MSAPWTSTPADLYSSAIASRGSSCWRDSGWPWNWFATSSSDSVCPTAMFARSWPLRLHSAAGSIYSTNLRRLQFLDSLSLCWKMRIWLQRFGGAHFTLLTSFLWRSSLFFVIELFGPQLWFLCGLSKVVLLRFGRVHGIGMRSSGIGSSLFGKLATTVA